MKYKQGLDTYWRKDHWADVPDGKFEGFVHTVQQLTACFTCKTCGQLLDHDSEYSDYMCMECAKQQVVMAKVSAAWTVIEK